MYFSIFALNTEIFKLNLCAQSKYGKIWTRKKLNIWTIIRSGSVDFRNLLWLYLSLEFDFCIKLLSYLKSDCIKLLNYLKSDVICYCIWFECACFNFNFSRMVSLFKIEQKTIICSIFFLYHPLQEDTNITQSETKNKQNDKISCKIYL